MPFAPSPRSRPLDYFILHEAKPTGPSVGHYEGKDIPASVVDEFGRQYLFAGIAPRRWNGGLDVDALRTGEFILMPGLIYRLQHLRPSWFESLFGFR
jgi:hypothetical protein